MARVFRYKGKTPEELSQLSLKEVSELLPAEKRRNIKRGLTVFQKKLLTKIKKAKESEKKKPIKTHSRNMMILPEMFGAVIHVHNGKEFVPLEIRPEMMGWNLGDFVSTRKDVKHAAPGVGATRGSKHQSTK